jgi:hypothetical protein
MVDILASVNGPPEPFWFFASTVPGVAERVAVHHGPDGSSIFFEGFRQRFKRNAVLFHAVMYPQDQTLARIPVEIERGLFLSLFHDLPKLRRLAHAC